MSLAMWIGLGLLAWVVVAVLVALLVGRIVRQRDRQVPDPGPGDEVAGRAGAPDPAGRSRGPGGTQRSGPPAQRRPPLPEDPPA